MAEARVSLVVPAVAAGPDLIARARQDVTAFGELYRRHYDLVYRHCLRRLFSPDAAEEVTAEVFLRTVEKFDGFRGDEAAFRVWLYRLATNAVNEHLRRRGRRRRLLDALAREPAPGDAPESQSGDSAPALRRALLRLDMRPQALIALRYFEDLPHEEIAAIVGGSPATVRNQISRALVRLRKLLEGDRHDSRERT
jgi:RNA polymerase sigma-70 factor (ECF subfamily)